MAEDDGGLDDDLAGYADDAVDGEGDGDDGLLDDPVDPLPLGDDNPVVVEESKKDVTRLQMLEYMVGRRWWRSSQQRIIFTTCMWATIFYIVVYRSEVPAAHSVQTALTTYVQTLVAHPGISGTQLRTPGESSMACRCGCRHVGGFPDTACFLDQQTEPFSFYANLPEALAADLVAKNGGAYPPNSQEMPPVTWDSISTMEDVIMWLEFGFLPDVWGTVAAKVVRRPGLVLGRNLVIGGVRLRQIRAKVNSAACELKDELSKWYLIECRSTKFADDSYGPPGGAQVEETAQEAFVPSRMANPGEGIYDALFDVERPLKNALDTAAYLRRNRWLSPATRSVHVQTLMLNAEGGTFVVIDIKFEFGFDGLLTKKVIANAIKPQPAAMSLTDMIAELVWVVLVGCLFFQELWEIFKLARSGEMQKYFRDFWNILDWISISVGVGITVYTIMINGESATLSKTVAGLPRAPIPTGLNGRQYRDLWSKSIDDAAFIYTLQAYLNLCLFWYSSVVTLRYLRSFLGQAKLTLIQLTLQDGFWDVLHFFLMFIVFLINFVVGGKALFGTELKEWSTWSQSVSTALMIQMGAAKFDRLYEVAPVNSHIWYWLFLLIMVFLMLNLLLVINIEYFGATRASAGDTQGIPADIKALWKDFVWRFDWRRDQFSEGEYWACFTGDPYDGLIEGLMTNSAVDESMEKAADRHCLGLRLGRKMMEDLSVEVLSEKDNPGVGILKSLELRKIGCDASTAEHLLDECRNWVNSEKSTSHLSQLNQVRTFVGLLRDSRQVLDKHCARLEEGYVDDQDDLEEILERLEDSVEFTFDGFVDLTAQGIDSLAPPVLGQGGEMKEKLPEMLETFQSTRNGSMGLRGTASGHDNNMPPAIGY